MIDHLIEKWLRTVAWDGCPVLVKDLMLKNIENEINLYAGVN